MNRKQKACAVAGFLFLAAVAFGQQQSSQNPSPSKPSGKTTAPKPIPCSQRLKAQINTNDELSNRIRILEDENAALRGLANELTARQQRSEQMLRDRDELIEKQEKLIGKSKGEHDLGLAAGMLLSEVSGTWKIQNANSGTGGICQVHVNYDSRTILLSNCVY